MKVDARGISTALDKPDGKIRLFLLYGPDEAGSRELADRLSRAMGPTAERVDLTGSRLKADPALLADEAASISLFGDARYIRVEGVGDDMTEAAQALLVAPSAGNPVVIVAGALRKDSKLLKLVSAHPLALCCVSYVPEGRAADQLAMELGQSIGLRMRPDIAHRLAAASGGDRAILLREIEKLACYLDADTAHPADLDHDAVDALSAGSEEGDLSRLTDLLLGGDASGTDAELALLGERGIEGVVLLRALLRRAIILADLGATVTSGTSIQSTLEAKGKALFWKDRQTVGAQLRKWPAPAAARLVATLTSLEASVKTSGHVPAETRDALLSLARDRRS